MRGLRWRRRRSDGGFAAAAPTRSGLRRTRRHAAGHENGVWIEHADGTVSNYLHMTQSSVVVAVGAAVTAGDLVGFSGNSGASDRPHLHVEAYASQGDFVKSNTLPITFSNLEGETALSGELLQDEAYTALAPSPSARSSAR